MVNKDVYKGLNCVPYAYNASVNRNYIVDIHGVPGKWRNFVHLLVDKTVLFFLTLLLKIM